MIYNIYTLHPNIFISFTQESLIARAISQDILQINMIDWREYGLTNYKSVDDKPFGGGSGMVLSPEPIYKALLERNAISHLFKPPTKPITHKKIIPSNKDFLQATKFKSTQKATILLTPRGFRYNQKVAEYLSNFSELNILCGRYEGFDARVCEMVDMEISLGDFILNGGEIASMSIIESVSRLLPGYITKTSSVLHDSFSSGLNWYEEQKEYIFGKKNISNPNNVSNLSLASLNQTVYQNLFNEDIWLKESLPFLEHPHYTRPQIWHNWEVPPVLLDGNHKLVQDWRNSGWRV